MDVIFRCFRYTEFDIDSYEPYYEWDIALLYIDEALPLGEHESYIARFHNTTFDLYCYHTTGDNVRPICLPEQGLEETTQGQFGMGFVTGWGMQWERKSHIAADTFGSLQIP